MSPPLRKYLSYSFVFSLVGGVVICLIASIPKGFGPWYLYVVCPLGFAVILGPLGGILSYWSNKRHERKRGELLNNETFAALFAMGFERKGDAAVDYIEGYPIIISYEWTPHEAIAVKMVFDPAGRQFTLKELKKLYKQHSEPGLRSWAVAWGKCFMYYGLQIGFKLPSHTKVLEAAHSMVAVLQKAGLKPGSFDFYLKEYRIDDK